MATEETIKRRTYHAARYAENPNRYARQKAAYFQEYYKRNKRTKQSYKLQKAFGITIEQYEEILAKQDGRCALCKSLPGKHLMAVDHNHATGKIRELLCRLCNRYIVFVVEKYPELVEQAKLYLEKHAE